MHRSVRFSNKYMCTYIYIYIYRERERDVIRGCNQLGYGRATTAPTIPTPINSNTIARPPQQLEHGRTHTTTIMQVAAPKTK